MNTKIAYQYRDADNYKQLEDVVIPGEISEKDKALILSKLDEGMYFIPSQVGLNDLQERMCSPIGDADHVWHELCEEDISLTNDDPTPNHPFDNINELVERFEALKKWDVISATQDLGL
jgi:hypothetical protein